ncbi:peptidase domain-containing ABC transporter [Ideonella sp. TBM-1]|uniref:Cyclolysin secretion/processing ATP-binding protein CyaB n=2 Tax=Ideonella livida TaxID=2707176 RepID=A0A7C9PJG8_9BURK|nr:peptidase domain-containing ABC transporter [Ideonella livida]
MKALGAPRHRVPVILQTEAAECGLACLAMVAGAHGLHTDLPTLRRRFQLSLKGATAADVCDMGAALGLVPRALRAEPEHLAQLRLPCILHWDLNHFVVLVAVKSGQAVVHDPARGLRRMALAELSGHFTGVVLELAPGAAFRPGLDRQRITMTALMGRVTGLRRALAQVLVLALALELFVMLSPFFLQWVVDQVLVSGERELLLTLGVGFGGLVLLQAATAWARGWALLHISASLQLQWVGHVFAHLLRLPLAWFERRHTGDVWSRFEAVQAIQNQLTQRFAEAVIDGLMVLLTLGLMLLYSPLLAGVAAAAVALYALLRAGVDARLREATEEALVHRARRTSHFLESLRGMATLKLFNAEGLRQSRFMNLMVDELNAGLDARRLEMLLATGHRLLFGLERVLVVGLGAGLVLDQRLSTGMLFAFLAYQEQFATRTSALVDKWGEWRLLRLQAERLADIVMTPPEEAQAVAPPRASPGPAALALCGLRFRYSDLEPWVLDGVDLELTPGESVAIVGASGCGKTTLVKLLLGVHAPQAGEVLLDGVPLARWGHRAWRAQLGTVLQEDALFAGSIADNIVCFSPEPDEARLRECARMAALDADIEALPMGYASLVGDMGTALSGGQRQRLLLARALYRQPRLLVLDEATSALDVEGERLVNAAVQRLALTRVIVAHRPQTIASADRVIELREGRVVRDERRPRA